MSKYSDFPRHNHDLYPTPLPPVLSLRKAMGDVKFKYWEPCCAEGLLVKHIDHLFPKATCAAQSDLETSVGGTRDLFSITHEEADELDINYFITNPPWMNKPSSGYQLFRLINHLASIRPTILLLNANICWNKGSWTNKLAPMPFCQWIKPTARIKWIPESAFAGKEDCAWFCFNKTGPLANMTGPMILPRD